MAHRTQITLTDEQYARLRLESVSTGASLSELIRQAVDQKLARPTIEERKAALEESFGVWKDRTDIPESTAEYVRQLRGPGMGERLKRLGIDDGL
jgi:hypothetical protein